MTSDSQDFIERLRSRLRERQQPAALASTLLRIGNARAFDLVARTATTERLGHDELCVIVAAGGARARRTVADGDPAWLQQVAQIAALRRVGPDPAAALALLDLIREVHGPAVFDADTLALYAQLLVLLDRGSLAGLLDVLQPDALPELVRWSVRTDAVNPFSAEADAAPTDEWAALLAAPFTGGGLEPATVAGTSETPFDRLHATPSTYVDEEGLVTVVMSAYRPNRSILAAARSILQQSWRNLELLVVDDSSPAEFGEILAEVAAMDDRVRVLRTPVNAGTYMVRNFALQHARGEFVTFQDFDDWAHPRRLELQIAPLRTDARLLATRSRALRAFPDLRFTYLGYPPDRINASSLLFRRSVIGLIGYFDAVRKSADVEYPERLQAAAPGSVLDLRTHPPLAVCQLRTDSLSRSDAIPGWMHWSRLAYREAFRARNKRVRDGAASAYFDGDPERRLLPLPAPSWAVSPVSAAPASHHDVVVLNDWRRGKSGQNEVVADIRAMLDDGLRVAVAHVETLEPVPKEGRRQSIATPLQQLVNDGDVEFTHLTQPTKADLVLVYDPATLEFPPDVSAGLQPERVAVLVGPRGQHAAGERFEVTDVIANAQRLFSRGPLWVPRDRRSRTQLREYGGGAELSDFNLLQAFEPAHLEVHVQRLRGPRPVIGRHVPDRPQFWPANPKDLLAAYPDDDRVDVRVLGGVDTPRTLLANGILPPNWVAYDDHTDTRTFLAQLDFYVYFPDGNGTAVPGTAVPEAIASGCVVVLPPSFEPLYGDAAVYCRPREVREIVSALHGSPVEYAEQQRRARRQVSERYGVRAFQAGVRKLLRG